MREGMGIKDCAHPSAIANSMGRMSGTWIPPCVSWRVLGVREFGKDSSVCCRMFSVISTRKDLAKIYHCKNLLVIFSNFKYCRINSDPVVRTGLANCRDYTGEI